MNLFWWWKDRNDIGGRNCCFYSSFFGPCHVTFPFKEFFSFFGYCGVTFPYMAPFFFSRFVQNVKYLVFEVQLMRKRLINQMVAVLLQVITSFFTTYSKNSLFISANTDEKYNVSEECCFARHDDRICFLHICRYHIILIGNIKELLQNRMPSVSTTNTWTVCIHISGTVSVAKSLSRVDNFLLMCRGQFNCPALRKRDILGKCTKNSCCAPFGRLKQRRVVYESLQTELKIWKD